tara:strand:- start:215 stop:2092 length:1878 start_codon:yes stop_codon:yes gene_type:complete
MADWKPDLHYITELLSDLELRFQERNDLVDQYWDILTNREEFDIPEAYEHTTLKVKTGLPMTWIRKEVGALTTLPFSVHVPPPPGATPEDKLNGETIERFLPALWKQIETQQKRDIYRDLIHDMVATGWGVLKAIYRPTAWQGMPELREMFDKKSDNPIDYSPEELKEYNRKLDNFIAGAPVPFTFRTVDVRTVYPVWGEFGVDAVIENSRRPFSRVQRMAGPFGGVPIMGDDMDPTDEVEVVEYWDDKWMALVINTGGRGGGAGGSRPGWHFVGAMEHGLGRIPYWFAPGEETGSTEEAYRAVSALFGIKDINAAINLLSTIKLNRAYLTGFPTYQSRSVVADEDGEGGVPRPVSLEIGKINPVDPDDPRGIEPVNIPEFTGDVESMIGLLLQYSSSTQMDDTAAGGGAFSGESGFLRAMRTEQARAGYHQIIAHAERELSDFMNWILQMMEEYSMKLHILEKRQKVAPAGSILDEDSQWISLNPEQINGYHAVEVRIEPFNPVMDIARGTYAANQAERGFWSSRFAREFAGIKQPEVMEDEITAERITQALDQQIAEAAIARLGFGGPADEPQQMAMLGPDGQPLNPALAGALGGRPPASPGIPGAGAPLVGPANGPNVPIGP